MRQNASRWNGHKTDATEAYKTIWNALGMFYCLLWHASECVMMIFKLIDMAVVHKWHDQIRWRSLGASILYVEESSSLIGNKSSVVNSVSESLKLLHWGARLAWVLLYITQLSWCCFGAKTVLNSSEHRTCRYCMKATKIGLIAAHSQCSPLLNCRAYIPLSALAGYVEIVHLTNQLFSTANSKVNIACVRSYF